MGSNEPRKSSSKVFGKAASKISINLGSSAQHSAQKLKHHGTINRNRGSTEMIATDKKKGGFREVVTRIMKI